MGEVEQATRDEIDQMGAEAVAPGLAAAALLLARQMDATDAPTAAAVVARELRALMSDLRRLSPGAEEVDGLDELNARRAARRGA